MLRTLLVIYIASVVSFGLATFMSPRTRPRTFLNVIGMVICVLLWPLFTVGVIAIWAMDRR